MDIESKFLRILNNSFKQAEDAFAICPKVFYQGLSQVEISSMQQLYRIAYEKAKAKTQNSFNGFYNGDGI